jgi:GIY-YIG catalytic domain.
MPLFYILYSPTRKRYYVGHTTEPIEERVRKHKSNHSGFTGKTGDWRVVYSEER